MEIRNKKKKERNQFLSIVLSLFLVSSAVEMHCFSVVWSPLLLLLKCSNLAEIMCPFFVDIVRMWFSVGRFNQWKWMIHHSNQRTNQTPKMPHVQSYKPQSKPHVFNVDSIRIKFDAFTMDMVVAVTLIIGSRELFSILLLLLLFFCCSLAIVRTLVRKWLVLSSFIWKCARECHIRCV